MHIKYGIDLINLCDEKNSHIYDIAIQFENDKTGQEKEEILKVMSNRYKIMVESAKLALNRSDLKCKIIGGEAKKVRDRYTKEKPVCGLTMAKAISYALSTMEANASMNKIVASPTAGSCGVMPAVFLSLQESHGIEDKDIVNGLLTASMVGMIIAKNATLSGAKGGCQAEVGSASAMAAAGVVEIIGGSPVQALTAASIAIKNVMGLICDPIAGLVESPCSKRNAMGTSNALISAEMALAGIESVIPFDEVVDAMYRVGNMLPCSLKETSLGGIAITPTGKKIKKEIFGDDK